MYSVIKARMMHVISLSSTLSYVPLPLFQCSVPAGFPSPAQDYEENRLDLNELCVQHPAATYFVRVSGDSMIGAGIHDGDLLVVDRSLAPKHGDIVIAGFHGELTVKRLELTPVVRLVPMNKHYPIITIPDDTDLDIHGVVLHTLHSFKRTTNH
jgi:DNA polymerase V